MASNKISELGLELLKQFEGFSPTVYFDQGGLPTIGYGTLIDQESEEWLMTASIDRKTAEQLLLTDLRPTETYINKAVKVELTQNRYDALCCFAYNVGIGAFARSTLLKKINYNPSDASIYDEFLKWSYVKKKLSEGLMKRRVVEAKLYFNL
jgi:lysozyme